MFFSGKDKVKSSAEEHISYAAICVEKGKFMYTHTYITCALYTLKFF